MKSQLSQLQYQHAVTIGSMQLHFKLAKTIEDLLRIELSCVQQSCDAGASEIQIHAQLAKRLENQLRVELSFLEEVFNELEKISIELMNLQCTRELEEAEL